MKEILNDGRIKLTPTDWRYSAAILGIYRIFAILGDITKFEIKDDEFIYNPKDITPEKLSIFLPRYYGENEFHHLRVKNMLLSPEPEKYTKEINDILKGGNKSNSICKKLLGHLKFDGTNAKDIIDAIDENNIELTIKTFEFKRNMYCKYCNSANGQSTLFMEDSDICRILGYYVQTDRKGKALGYNFQKNEYTDIQEFDYIVFGFSIARGYDSSIFINSNFSINSLINVNNKVLEPDNIKYSLVENLRRSSNFVNDNVEIIIKNADTDYFESLILNKRAINIFKNIKHFDSFTKFNIKITDDNWINMQESIIDAIINNQYIDHLINFALKSDLKNKIDNKKIYNLIEINQLLYKEGKKMLDKFKPAYVAAKQVNGVMNENKVKSFKEKLISAVTVDDKDTVSKTLLKLSQASGVYFGFANDIFDDYDGNKNILYIFINALATKNYEKGEDNNEK